VRHVRVYVAGPIGLNDEGRTGRVACAMDAGEELRRAGLFPFIPHALVHWDAIAAHSYECWMRYDDAWLRVCDALLRLPGMSPGADREVVVALELGIPVFAEIADVVKWAAAQ